MTLDCRGGEVKKLICLLGIIPIVLNAQIPDKEYVQFCFASSRTASMAAQEISFLKVKTDKINKVNECIDIYVAPRRVNLFIKFTKLKFPNVKVLEISSNFSKRQCDLELKEESFINSIHLNAGIDNSKASLGSGKLKRKNTKISNLILLEGLEGHVDYNGHKITVLCFIKREGLEIKFTYTSKDFSINSTRFIQKNKSIELGGLTQSQSGDQDKKSLKAGLNFSSFETNKDYKLFIKAK